MISGLLKRLMLKRPVVEAVEMSPVRWRPGTGWHSWLAPRSDGAPSPYQHEFVRLMREGWDAPQVANPSELSPFLNVVGLYWQPIDGDVIDAAWAPAPVTRLIGGRR